LDVDSNMLDKLIGAKIVKFDYMLSNGQLDAVIVEINEEQYSIYADNTDDLGIVKYK
jgi:hypothetical protein